MHIKIKTSTPTFIKIVFLFLMSTWVLIIIGLFKVHWMEFKITRLKRNVISTKIDRFEVSALLLDMRKEHEEQIMNDIEERVPSLPIIYWSKYRHFLERKNTSCAPFPSIFDLYISNLYWQTMFASNATFQLYSAYYDMRKRSTLGPTVRILGMIDRVDVKIEIFCQFWFDGRKEPVIVKNFGYRHIWNGVNEENRQGTYQPYLIICKIPEIYHGFVPSSVSIVEKQCDKATNILRVIYNLPPDDRKSGGFAVCVKGLDFPYEDISVRLIEWIELLHILGVDKIYFYSLQLHANISNVLRHYEQAGKVEVMPLTLPGGQPNAPLEQHIFLKKMHYFKKRNEIIPYNDCFYKNMYLYDYITMLDIDEIIMPNDGAKNWSEMMQNVKREESKNSSKSSHSYSFENFYYTDGQEHEHDLLKDIPKFMHMLRHVQRANESNGMLVKKCIHDTQRVFMVQNHCPIGCLDGICKIYPVDAEIGRLQHHRSECTLHMENCTEFGNNVVVDKIILNYKEQLIRRVRKTFNKLGLTVS